MRWMLCERPFWWACLYSAADQPPDWYYGDGSRPLTHPNNRRALILIAMVAAIGGLLVLFLRRRRARGEVARPA